jgi:alkylhydroperoxidase family enzyme
MNIRIAPASPPYTADVTEDLQKLMPPGMAPIGLFRTLAKNPRVLRRIRRGGLLDRGSITVRQREIVILRTTARAGAEYEWGVHAGFFGPAAGLDDRCLHATVWGAPDDECWSPDESVLLQTCDELHAHSRLSEASWSGLRDAFAEDQILEVLVLAGFYRAIAYVVNVTGIALEEGAYRFPPKRTGDSMSLDSH